MDIQDFTFVDLESVDGVTTENGTTEIVFKSGAKMNLNSTPLFVSRMLLESYMKQYALEICEDGTLESKLFR